MSIQLNLELNSQQSIQSIARAITIYQVSLQRSIKQTQQRLKQFEEKYNVTTDYFLNGMVGEDLSDGDLEYVEWAGEAHLLSGLNLELNELENVSHQFS